MERVQLSIRGYQSPGRNIAGIVMSKPKPFVWRSPTTTVSHRASGTRAREARCDVVHCYISPPNRRILDARSAIVVMRLSEDGGSGTGTQRWAEGVNCPHLPPPVPYQLAGRPINTLHDPTADMCGSC